MRSLFAYLVLCLFAANLTPGQEVTESQPLKVPFMAMAARLLTTVTPKPSGKPMAKCSDRAVDLDAIIGADGKVKSVKVLGGFEEFQESAMEAVKQWTYKPFLEYGRPIAVETTIMVFYPSSGPAGPLFVPDGKGGVKGGKFVPLPPECKEQTKAAPGV